jgi:Zn-dependent protease with chaperone function
MSLVLDREEKIENDNLKTPLYTLYERHIIIQANEGKKVFNLDEIANIRLQKKRNLSVNIFILFFTLLVYSITSDYFDSNFICYILLLLFTVVFSIVSLWLEHYTYVLFFNTSDFNYIKLRLSKKDLPSALHLVSLFKSGYLIKYN